MSARQIKKRLLLSAAVHSKTEEDFMLHKQPFLPLSLTADVCVNVFCACNEKVKMKR